MGKKAVCAVSRNHLDCFEEQTMLFRGTIHIVLACLPIAKQLFACRETIV